jgi:DNA replication protein DnaC
MEESPRESSTQESLEEEHKLKEEALIPALHGEDNLHNKQNEPTQTEEVDLPVTIQSQETEYVFRDVAIHQHETNVIYGDSGVGKSLFSIAIGNCDKIKKGLYILVDNYSEKDVERL